MLKNYTPSKREEKVTYELQFYVDRNGGYGFPCDKDGNLLMNEMNEYSLKNYKDAMAHPERYKTSYNKVVEIRNRYRVPAHGTCHCGEEVYMENQYMGACQCPNCGQWYNLVGQELLPPDQWEESY